MFAPDPASLPTPSTRPDLRTASLPACAPRTAPASAQQARHTPDRNEHRQERRLDTARTRASTDCPPHGGETQWQAPALRRFRATWMRRPQRRGAPPASMGTHRRLPGVTRACLEPGSTVSRDREALVRLVRTRGEGALQAGGLWGPFPARSAPSGWDRQTAKKRGLPGRGAAWRVGRDATPARNGGSRLKCHSQRLASSRERPWRTRWKRGGLPEMPAARAVSRNATPVCPTGRWGIRSLPGQAGAYPRLATGRRFRDGALALPGRMFREAFGRRVLARRS